jgi:hypothetical protein
MSLSKNMYRAICGQLALCTSSCGSALWLCAVPKPNGLGIAFKENDRKKLVMTSEKPFATASLEIFV